MNASYHNSTNRTLLLPSVFPIHLCISPTAYKAIAGITAPFVAVNICMNVAIITTFLKRRRLITPFTVNIMALSFIGIIHGLVFYPQVTVRPIFDNWLNQPFSCAVFQYTMWVIPALTLMQDVVICLDRWVALLAPMWYRSDNKLKYSLMATAIVIVWVHVWYLPLNILNFHTPMAARFGCDSTIYPVYRLVVGTMVTSIPQLLAYGSYVVLLGLLWRRRSHRLGVSQVVVSYVTRSSAVCQSVAGVESVAETVRRNRAEQSNNRLTIVLISVKLVAITCVTVPSSMLMLAAAVQRLPPRCTWDAFHLSEQLLSVAQIPEPFIYLFTLDKLRTEFCDVFRIGITRSPRLSRQTYHH
ncbi:hypothetical protein BV898_08819 [Hypsibius exemplaris]|uniref:G-protein coupled receptors family 1 profile domain-containing protein n=1 Tax=Hypsibius exemplaris TaxID=2072580 RepID=A0A1W0WPN2_HYPEX|nr:hypothetical protein BV898_08819 [Hypsibius exemplaris]